MCNRNKAPKVFAARDARKMLGIVLSAEAKSDPDKATERQASALSKFGVSEPAGLSFVEASDLMTALVGRIKAGLCSLRQMAWLINQGIQLESARETPFKDASAFITEGKLR